MNTHALKAIVSLFVLSFAWGCSVTTSSGSATCESTTAAICERAASCSTDGKIREGDNTYSSLAECKKAADFTCPLVAAMGVSVPWNSCTDAVNNGGGSCEPSTTSGQNKYVSPAACEGSK